MEIIKHAKNPVRFVVRTVATRVEVPKAVSTPTGDIALNNQVRKAKANTLISRERRRVLLSDQRTVLNFEKPPTGSNESAHSQE